MVEGYTWVVAVLPQATVLQRVRALARLPKSGPEFPQPPVPLAVAAAG